jgi:hypothetical protein
VDRLAGLLSNAPERNEWTDRSNARFLEELSPGGVEQIFTGIDDAFGDGPRSDVAISPERAAWVRDEYLQRPA